MYNLIRPALFSLDAERAHHLTLSGLAHAPAVARRLYGSRVPDCSVRVMGLDLPNPVGLAAGLDKDATAIAGLGGLGFGFVEVGTVTPVAQPGNAKPRLFRLTSHNAIINRMGFNNGGVQALCERVRASNWGGVLGINIGRNADTRPEQTVNDYLTGLAAVYALASYVTINISSPNTKGLRDMQGGDALDELLGRLVRARDGLAGQHGRRVPLAVKIAPDLDSADLAFIAQSLVEHGIDGVIATNTTISRDNVPERWRDEAGGLSGRPVTARSTQVIAELAECLDGALPIIGVGGIDSGAAAVEKLAAGASAVQIYTGLIYRGPALVRECVEAAARYMQSR